MPELTYLRPRAASRVRRAGHLREPHRAAMPAARASSCFRSTRRPLGLPSTSPRSHRSSKHCVLPRSSLLLTRLPAAAGTAAVHRREPSPALLPPIPGHQIRSDRAGGRSPTFPRPRAAADSPESGHPRRRPNQGLNCESPNLPRGFHAKQGPTCKKTETSKVPGAKRKLQ
jgi:hypothetical protein